MESYYRAYDSKESDERVREILEAAGSFVELEDFPPRGALANADGYYVKCVALCIDIRTVKGNSEENTLPVLAKLYRSFYSECVAVIDDNASSRGVFVAGNSVVGILRAHHKSAFDGIFSTAAMVASAIKLINWRLSSKGFMQIEYGIGVAFGSALMLKAGYDGRESDDIIWMGDVVNEALNLSSEGGRGKRLPLQVSPVIYKQLNKHNRALLMPVYLSSLPFADGYEGDVVNAEMENYLEGQRRRSELDKTDVNMSLAKEK